MTQKLGLVVLLGLLALYFYNAGNAKADNLNQAAQYTLPKPLDSSVHRTIDSVQTVKFTISNQQELLKSKVLYLEHQQQEIKETQRRIDSLSQIGLATN
jgi:hypothetical protein